TIPPTQVAGAITNVSCNGFDDGAIALTVTAGTPPYEYSWTGPGGYSNDVPNISGLEPGVYTVVVTDFNECQTTASFTVTEPAPISFSFVVSNQVCANENDGAINATVSGGTPPYSYLWSGPNGYSANTEDIEDLAPGEYTLTVTDNNGCVAVSAVPVEVVAAPPVNIVLGIIGLGGPSFCQGGSVTLGDLNATPGDAYQWQIDTTGTFENIAGANSPTFLVTSTEILLQNQIRYYRLVVTQGTCVFTSDPFTITIFARPDVTHTVQTSANDDSPYNVCVGEHVSISVPVEANMTYEWYINGRRLTTPTGPSITFTIKDQDTTITDFFNLTFTLGMMDVRSVLVIKRNVINGCVSVSGIPPFVPQSTPNPVPSSYDTIKCANTTLVLSVTPETSTNYEWWRMNEGGNPLNLGDYTLVGSGLAFNVTSVIGGVDFYRVRGIRIPSQCFDYSDPIRVTESVLQIVSITPTPGGCFNNSLNVVATTNTDPNANPITYVLSGGTLSDPDTNATGNFTGLGAGTYTLKVFDAAGCELTQTVNYQLPTPTITGITALSPTSVQLNISYPSYGDPDRVFVVRYRVYPEPPSDGGPGQFPYDETWQDDQPTVTITGLQNNTRYEFFVFAACYDDPLYVTSDVSNFVYVTTPQLVEPCIRPGGLYVRVYNTAPTTAYVYWNWEPNTYYEVRYRLSGPVDGEDIVYNQEFPGSGSCIGTFAAPPATITITDLFPQTAYEIEVRKLCAGCTYDENIPGDVSPYSATITFQTGGACIVPTATVSVNGSMDASMTSYCGDVTLTAEVDPADPGNYYYRWQYSNNGGVSYSDVLQGYGENELVTNEFAYGTGLYRVLVRAGVCNSDTSEAEN
ncbi:MAG: hypothetical protein NZ534_07295, partial [Bacteroidia bacterium]|nr:hypothetical protein [Bacteroidia bacterium]